MFIELWMLVIWFLVTLAFALYAGENPPKMEGRFKLEDMRMDILNVKEQHLHNACDILNISPKDELYAESYRMVCHLTVLLRTLENEDVQIFIEPDEEK